MSKTIGLITANYNTSFGEVYGNRAIAALPFGGRYRLIDFPLSNMANSGITTVGLVVPFNNSSLIDHVGTGKAWGFGRKTHSLFMLPGTVYGKGNGESEFMLKDILNNPRFFTYDNADHVLMCGSNRVFTMDFRTLIKQHEMTSNPITKVFKGDEFMDCFIIDTAFLKDIVNWFSNLDYMDILDIVAEHLPDTAIGRYEFVGYQKEIDTISDYFEAHQDLLKESVDQMLFHSAGTIYTNIQDRCPTFFAPTANVKNSVIAAGCTIEGTVEDSIIFRSSHIAAGATVKKCVLMQHTEVEPGAELEYFISDKRVRVTSGVKISGSETSPYFAKKGQII